MTLHAIWTRNVCVLASLFLLAPSASTAQRGSPPERSLTLDVPRLTIEDAAADGRWVIQGFRETQAARDGGFLVASGAEIHRFSPSGRHVSVAGGSGRGPGEFTQISAMAECPDGAIVVADWVQHRATRLPPGRQTAQVVPFPPNVTNAVAPIACDAKSGVFLDHSLNLARPAPSPRGTLRQDTLLILRGQLALDQLDTIARIAGSASFDGLIQPFGARAGWSLNHQVLVVGRTNDSILRVLPRTSGTAMDVVVRGLPVMSITSQMRRDRIARSERSTPPAIWKAELKAAFDNVPWPTHLPLWDRIVVDDASRIWVREFQSPLEVTPKPSRWRIVNSRGVALATLVLPPEDDLITVRENDAIIVHRSADDSESLQVRRIRGF